jgi:hypothetical protein
MTVDDVNKLSDAASETYVNEHIAAAALNTFQREYNGEVGIGVAVIPDGTEPTVTGSNGDIFFTLAYEPTPFGDVPAGWIVISWEWNDGAWYISGSLPPIAAVDLHWVAVKNGDDIAGYYIIKTGDDEADLPEWELLGATSAKEYKLPAVVFGFNELSRLFLIAAGKDRLTAVASGYYSSTGVPVDAENTIFYAATQDYAGIMTAADKKKLDGLAPDNWAYNEVDTGATFVDGKKIYSKTIDCGALPNNTTNVIAHGIANIDNIIEMTAFATDGTYFFPLNYCSPNATSNTGVYIDKSNIYPVTGKDMRAFNATVRLKYTCTDR